MATKWSTEEIQKMNDMILMKDSFGKIAKELGRSPLAIKYKFGRQYRKKVKNDFEEINAVNNTVTCSVDYNGYNEPNDINDVKYGSPISICVLFFIVVIGSISTFVCGSGVFMITLMDSIQKIKPY